jgi:hypothetical protein
VRSLPRFGHSFWQNKTVLSAAAQDAVEVALYASLSNVLFLSQSSGSTELEKVRLRSRATTRGRGGTRYVEVVSRRMVQQKIKSISRECSHNFLSSHDEWPIYTSVCPWQWLSCAGEGILDPNIVARSL